MMKKEFMVLAIKEGLLAKKQGFGIGKWEKVVDFTKIKKGGIEINELIRHLSLGKISDTTYN